MRNANKLLHVLVIAILFYAYMYMYMYLVMDDDKEHDASDWVSTAAATSRASSRSRASM